MGWGIEKKTVGLMVGAMSDTTGKPSHLLRPGGVAVIPA
jgi:hypothetical protein